MALSGHHVGSDCTQSHRHAALQMLRESLDNYSHAGDGHPVLDTIIILFTLDVRWPQPTQLSTLTEADSMH